MSTTALHPLSTEQGRIAIRLAALNECAPEMAWAQFKRCCGSSQWGHRMERARPFSDIAELESYADRIWVTCLKEDWLEAFAAHPQIGQKSGSQWSRQEQSGISAAESEVLKALSEANRAYEAKFGYKFIVCATGKSAVEMLAMAEQRLCNSVEVELQNAAEQERQIMRLRLRKMLAE